MSNNDMINGYDQVQEDDDLSWLARNRHDWPTTKPYAVLTQDRAFVVFVDYDEMPAVYSGPSIGRDRWQQRRAELQNKPSWDDHNYYFICQNRNGKWFGYDIEPIQNDKDQCWMHLDRDFMFQGRRHLLSKGEVLGDWRNTLEKRPDCNCDGCTDGDDVVIPPPPQYDPKDVAFAPSKYHRKINGKWCDVYDILQTWNVTSPALQHLIKKALQAGQRGHKDLETDMQDIIDSAVRAKELVCNKNT